MKLPGNPWNTSTVLKHRMRAASKICAGLDELVIPPRGEVWTIAGNHSAAAVALRLAQLSQPSDLHVSTFAVAPGALDSMRQIAAVGHKLELLVADRHIYATLAKDLEALWTKVTWATVHAKVIVLGDLVVTGSANWTYVKGLEVATITNAARYAGFMRRLLGEQVDGMTRRQRKIKEGLTDEA